MDKKEIRKKIRQTFKEIMEKNKEDLQIFSMNVCEKILSSSEYKNCNEIFGYMALEDEVDLSLVLKTALQQGKKIALPKVVENTGKMDFYYVTDMDVQKQTETGYCGIKEPDISILDKVDKDNSQENCSVLILVPGRAFTKDGKRLGRGKGFYDIFLEQFMNKKKSVAAGVCFPFQIMEDLPVTATDIIMNKVFY